MTVWDEAFQIGQQLDMSPLSQTCLSSSNCQSFSQGCACAVAVGHSNHTACACLASCLAFVKVFLRRVQNDRVREG